MFYTAYSAKPKPNNFCAILLLFSSFNLKGQLNCGLERDHYLIMVLLRLTPNLHKISLICLFHLVINYFNNKSILYTKQNYSDSMTE